MVPMRPRDRSPRPAALLLLAVPALAGCDARVAGVPAWGGLAALNVASVMTVQRSVPDVAVSAWTGRDCSVVRLERGEGYCREAEPPPPPPPFCTRSLGAVDCWSAPPPALPAQRGVADGPWTLTAAQERHRTRRWPGLGLW